MEVYMKIKELLSVHSSYQHPDGIPDILGDSFLLTENLVYRNIRQVALGWGCELVEASPDYLTNSFSQLPQIINDKKIPYKRSLAAYLSVEQRRPNNLFVEDMPERLVSYHFHECTHVIAENLFDDLDLKSQNEKILKILISESFANAVESIANVFTHSKAHEMFYMHNSYIQGGQDNRLIKNNLLEKIGMKALFKLTFYSYLCSNFLYKTYPYENFLKLTSFIFGSQKVPQKTLKDCHKLFLLGIKLSVTFKIHTAQFYFTCEGYDGDIFDLLNFNFLKIIKKDEHLLRVIDKMSDLVEFGISSQAYMQVKKIM
jgi:hypothetical protein